MEKSLRLYVLSLCQDIDLADEYNNFLDHYSNIYSLGQLFGNSDISSLLTLEQIADGWLFTMLESEGENYESLEAQFSKWSPAE